MAGGRGSGMRVKPWRRRRRWPRHLQQWGNNTMNNAMSRQLAMCNKQTNTLTNAEITTAPPLPPLPGLTTKCNAEGSEAQRELVQLLFQCIQNTIATVSPLHTCLYIHTLTYNRTHPHTQHREPLNYFVCLSLCLQLLLHLYPVSI